MEGGDGFNAAPIPGRNCPDLRALDDEHGSVTRLSTAGVWLVAPEREAPAGDAPEIEYRGAAAGPAAAARVSGYRMRRAVVVGIDNYDASGGVYKTLRFPADDARAVLASLRDDFGFATLPHGIAIGAGVDDERIRATWKAWPPSNAVGADDLVVFYYAGHGGFQGEMVGCNGKTVPRNEIVDWLSGLLCRHKLLILDSCHAGNVLLPEAEQLRDVPSRSRRGRLCDDRLRPSPCPRPMPRMPPQRRMPPITFSPITSGATPYSH